MTPKRASRAPQLLGSCRSSRAHNPSKAVRVSGGYGSAPPERSPHNGRSSRELYLFEHRASLAEATCWPRKPHIEPPEGCNLIANCRPSRVSLAWAVSLLYPGEVGLRSRGRRTPIVTGRLSALQTPEAPGGGERQRPAQRQAHTSRCQPLQRRAVSGPTRRPRPQGSRPAARRNKQAAASVRGPKPPSVPQLAA